MQADQSICQIQQQRGTTKKAKYAHILSKKANKSKIKHMWNVGGNEWQASAAAAISAVVVAIFAFVSFVVFSTTSTCNMHKHLESLKKVN